MSRHLLRSFALFLDYLKTGCKNIKMLIISLKQFYTKQRALHLLEIALFSPLPARRPLLDEYVPSLLQDCPIGYILKYSGKQSKQANENIAYLNLYSN